MKAIAVFPGNKEIKLIDHPLPEITKPTQAKVRILMESYQDVLLGDKKGIKNILVLQEKPALTKVG